MVLTSSKILQKMASHSPPVVTRLESCHPLTRRSLKNTLLISQVRDLWLTLYKTFAYMAYSDFNAPTNTSTSKPLTSTAITLDPWLMHRLYIITTIGILCSYFTSESSYAQWFHTITERLELSVNKTSDDSSHQTGLKSSLVLVSHIKFLTDNQY